MGLRLELKRGSKRLEVLVDRGHHLFQIHWHSVGVWGYSIALLGLVWDLLVAVPLPFCIGSFEVDLGG